MKKITLKRAGGYAPDKGRENHDPTLEEAARELGRRGGYARSDRMSSGQRKEAAIKAAKARWGEVRKRACPDCGVALGNWKMRRTHAGMAHADCGEVA